MLRIQKMITKSMLAAATCALLLTPVNTSAAEPMTKYQRDTGQALHVELLGRYTSGAEIGEGGTEIVAYDSVTHRAFSVNGAAKALDIIDLSVLKIGEQELPRIKQITLADLGVSASDVTSVAIHPDGEYIAVAAPAENKVDVGHVVFMTTDGDYLSHVSVGSLPDMLTFTSDGTKVLVANEGEPNGDYSVNPEGTVSIIDVSAGAASINDQAVSQVPFTDEIIEAGVRKVHPDSTYSQDLEPEYIVVDEQNQYAYVALQENNAIAKLDLENKKFVTVKSLGYKDFSVGKNKLDASNDDDEINITNWPVLSMYQPDGMASYTVNGQSYILSANEGDAQDYDGFSEEARVADLVDSYDLNADLFDGYSQEELDQLIAEGLFNDENLGRLNSTTSAPMNQEGNYEAIYGFGARSFSIWNANTLELAYDSGADFEEITKEVYKEEYFNTNNDENGFDSRSDDKGPEPETVTVGQVQGGAYAFIGLERTGGIMIYNISNPNSPTFNHYFSSRVFNEDEAVIAASGDVAPEGLTFIPADKSPTGQNILLAAHEISGTIAAYQIGIEVDAPVEEEDPTEEEENPKKPVDETPNPDVEEPEEDLSDEELPDQNENDVVTPVENNQDEDKIENEETQNSTEEISANQTNDTSIVQGEKLPNTATMNSTFLLLGSVLVVIGYFLYKRKNRVE
ncbi:choice-of-anchor I family protein [Metabacillus sp. FJAT-53654]|uniref:Choice-of-anchor I family protein n=1 Tax=Metabacillus rhizosphaerae TaxID=3117747 RepID=A0ABZ2MMK2_9BACI